MSYRNKATYLISKHKLITIISSQKKDLSKDFLEAAPYINYLFLGVEETKEVFGLK